MSLPRSWGEKCAVAKAAQMSSLFVKCPRQVWFGCRMTQATLWPHTHQLLDLCDQLQCCCNVGVRWRQCRLPNQQTFARKFNSSIQIAHLKITYTQAKARRSDIRMMLWHATPPKFECLLFHHNFFFVPPEFTIRVAKIMQRVALGSAR